MKTHVEKDLDKDWHRLIQEARTMGLRIDDVSLAICDIF